MVRSGVWSLDSGHTCCYLHQIVTASPHYCAQHYHQPLLWRIRDRVIFEAEFLVWREVSTAIRSLCILHTQNQVIVAPTDGRAQEENNPPSLLKFFRHGPSVIRVMSRNCSGKCRNLITPRVYDPEPSTRPAPVTNTVHSNIPSSSGLRASVSVSPIAANKPSQKRLKFHYHREEGTY